MNGWISNLEEWSFPDNKMSPIKKLPVINMAKNEKKGIQLLLEVDTNYASIKVNTQGNFETEVYSMVEVPVEYNTREATAQDGCFVFEEQQSLKPNYCSKLAPFRVYDCLKTQNQGEKISVINHRLPLYICVSPKVETPAGQYTIELMITMEKKVETLKVCLHVFDVHIPEPTFKVTNWFDINNMAKFHGTTYGTPEHLRMIRRYAKAMRRARQTHFFIPFEPNKARVIQDEYAFDFSYMKPIIEIFFEEGFQTMEVGYFALKHDDIYTDELKSAFDPKIKISSNEGYWITSEAIRSWKAFVQSNQWENKVIYHICDEPDVHCKNEMTVLKRKEQYFKIVNILHKHLPGAKIIEAIKTDQFKAGIDIFVPITVTLEDYIYNHERDYLRLLDEGNELWTYVCCAPSGEYLNRFMDIPLICSRLIFWGCSKYKLSGYLHWGFNQYINEFNPFEQSCCPNDTGQGTPFPSGDGHLVYPGEKDVYLSMRLEAQRRGLEDYELLKCLQVIDDKIYRECIDQIFCSFKEYTYNATLLEKIHSLMLEYLEKSSLEVKV